MATATELVFAEQFDHLAEVAGARAWGIQKLGPLSFKLELPAKDGSTFWLLVDCDGYPGTPPAWNWLNNATGQLNFPAGTPKGRKFLHGSGRICAPWNRLAYKEVDPKGPHGDWNLANWVTNPKTGACHTLAAMALRISVELQGTNYYGRMG